MKIKFCENRTRIYSLARRIFANERHLVGRNGRWRAEEGELVVMNYDTLLKMLINVISSIDTN